MPQPGRAQQGSKGGQATTQQPRRQGGAPRAGVAGASQGSAAATDRSKELTAQVTAVLGAFGYTEADIQDLVKSCGSDPAMIQERVSNILEEQNDGWNSSETKGEKATRAAEAKEKRLQLEKQQADEAARADLERTKKADAKYKALQQELVLRKTKQKAALLGGPAAAEAAATVKTSWQSPDEQSSPSAQPVQASEDAGAEHQEAAVEEEEVQAEAPEEQWSAPQVEQEQWHRPQSYAQSRWTPKAVQPESNWSPTETVEDTSWSGQGVAQAASVSEPSAPMPTTAPTPAPAPGQLPPEARALAVDDAVLSSSSVRMPPSYDLLFGSGQEPAVYFGTLHVDDTSGLVVSLKAPASPPTQAEVQESAEASAPQRNGRQRPGRGNWVPRGSGKGDEADGKAEAAEDAGESKPQRGRKGGGRAADQGEQGSTGENGGGKERKKGKGGKGGWGKRGKADGKGEGGEAGASRGEGKGASKGEGKGASKGRRQGDWQGQGEGTRKGDREKGGKS